MSYKPDNLSVLSYTNNFTFWHYVTSDENIQSDGYFDNASNMLRTNDLLIATTAVGTQFYIVFSDKGHASVLPFAEQKIDRPKMKRVDLDAEKWKCAVLSDEVIQYNRAIDDIKSKYGDLYVEVK